MMSCDIALKAREILANPTSTLVDFCVVLPDLIEFFERKFLSDVIEQYDDLLCAIAGLLNISNHYTNIVKKNLEEYAEHYMKRIISSRAYADTPGVNYRIVNSDNIIRKLAGRSIVSRKELLLEPYRYEARMHCRKEMLVHLMISGENTNEIASRQRSYKYCCLIIFVVVS